MHLLFSHLDDCATQDGAQGFKVSLRLAMHVNGAVQCREHLGGVLRYYHRQAA
jgi:hypothetical protein